jgi:hypothetical protein
MYKLLNIATIKKYNIIILTIGQKRKEKYSKTSKRIFKMPQRVKMWL